MKLLCVSDHIDPLVYSTTMQERFADVDLVLAAGDLPLSYYGFIVSSLNKPLLFVFGNHELKYLPGYRNSRGLPHTSFGSDYSTPSFGSTYVGGRVERIKGVIVAGLGGCPIYNRGPNQFNEFSMILKILRLVPRLVFNRIFFSRYLDVLLTHAPPHCINDSADQCHRGFKAFLWFVKRFRPKYMVHGHVHLYDRNAPRSTRYFETEIVNGYDHVVLEL